MINVRQRRILEFLRAENAQLHEVLDEQDSAITELAQLITDDEANQEDITEAVLELAELVGDSNG